MNCAMICNNRVVEVLFDIETKPKWPPTNYGEQIIAVECDNTVERGMEYDSETNTFAFPYKDIPDAVIEPGEEISIDKKLERIEEMLTTLTSDTVSADSITTAIMEGVNEV